MSADARARAVADEVRAFVRDRFTPNSLASLDELRDEVAAKVFSAILMDRLDNATSEQLVATRDALANRYRSTTPYKLEVERAEPWPTITFSEEPRMKYFLFIDSIYRGTLRFFDQLQADQYIAGYTAACDQHASQLSIKFWKSDDPDLDAIESAGEVAKARAA